MEELPTKKSFRHYLYFMAGQQFSLLGSGIIGFVITWWITVETQSILYLSLATFLIFLPQVIVTPFAGVLSDRLNRKSNGCRESFNSQRNYMDCKSDYLVVFHKD